MGDARKYTKNLFPPRVKSGFRKLNIYDTDLWKIRKTNFPVKSLLDRLARAWRVVESIGKPRKSQIDSYKSKFDLKQSLYMWKWQFNFGEFVTVLLQKKVIYVTAKKSIGTSCRLVCVCLRNSPSCENIKNIFLNFTMVHLRLLLFVIFVAKGNCVKMWKMCGLCFASFWDLHFKYICDWLFDFVETAVFTCKGLFQRIAVSLHDIKDEP